MNPSEKAPILEVRKDRLKIDLTDEGIDFKLDMSLSKILDAIERWLKSLRKG